MTRKAGRKIVFSLILTLLFFAVLLLGSYGGHCHGKLSSKVLRLHIIGNTDTARDQELKLLVRDSILKDYRHLFTRAEDSGDAIHLAQSSAVQMQATAEETLKRHGCLAPVSVRVEETIFPTKHYGSVSLPAGKYAAVNICIGKASGENWWCVLYPPLCLTEGTVTADQESLKILKKNLTPAEYAILTQPDKVTIRMKFRILEILGKIFS